jgi:hypothetical protein
MSDKISSDNKTLTAVSPYGDVPRESPDDGAIEVPSERGRPIPSLVKMVGKSKDPKGTRITVRISDNDLSVLQAEARRKNITVGAVVRTLIREGLGGNDATGAHDTQQTSSS